MKARGSGEVVLVGEVLVHLPGNMRKQNVVTSHTDREENSARF